MISQLYGNSMTGPEIAFRKRGQDYNKFLLIQRQLIKVPSEGVSLSEDVGREMPPVHISGGCMGKC